MAMLFIDSNKCRMCRRCLARDACKMKAIIRIDREDPPMINTHLCRDCRVCIPVCPSQAIRLMRNGGTP